MAEYASVEALHRAWREEYEGEWSALGVGPTARMYAHVVAEHRFRKRKSLSFGYALGRDKREEHRRRDQIRAQIDVLIDRDW